MSTRGQAADHSDSPMLSTNPMADITDVYAWVAGANLNLVMDVSPLDDGTHPFDPAVLYVFHVTSKPKLGVGETGGTETRVVLRFASNTSVQAWVTDASGQTTREFVSGDPSGPAGVAHGKLRVFAGRRSDPFFFNQAGAASGLAELGKNLTNVTTTDRCPAISPAEAGTIRTLFSTGSDAYASANVMAIVVQINKELVNATMAQPVVGVWASTHAGS
ncbi:MAG TPA: DUF4331 family protein [Kofleriaceae bacterium]|nr:DUF4331 family protein [Kofleriaceae bacterium]